MMLIKTLFIEWLSIFHKGEIKDRTYLRYKCIIDMHLIPLVGNYEVDQLSARELQIKINELETHISDRTNNVLSSSTINIAITILKMAFNYANDYEITSNNPTLRLKRIKNTSKNVVKTFARDEQIKIENYIESINNDEYFGIILTLYTGLRIGELLALTWDDVNLKSGLIQISKTIYKTKIGDEWEYRVNIPKTKSANRIIPIPLFLKDKLSSLKKKKISKYVISSNDGSMYSDKLLRYRFESLLKKIKVRVLNFHCLRHTFATRCLENKMDIKTLSEILGHSNVAITLNTYTHSLLDYKKQQMRKLKRLI